MFACPFGLHCVGHPNPRLENSLMSGELMELWLCDCNRCDLRQIFVRVQRCKPSHTYPSNAMKVSWACAQDSLIFQNINLPFAFRYTLGISELLGSHWTAASDAYSLCFSLKSTSSKDEDQLRLSSARRCKSLDFGLAQQLFSLSKEPILCFGSLGHDDSIILSKSLHF